MLIFTLETRLFGIDKEQKEYHCHEEQLGNKYIHNQMVKNK